MEITENIDILVGYFYFSGFDGIYKNLINKKVRILVGMDVETKIGNKVQEIGADKTNLSKLEIKERYFRDLTYAINETESFDNVDISRSWQVFLTKLQDGSLEIRKTAEPNHSKVYLFCLNEEVRSAMRTDGVLVTGSSNLTYSGLSGRLEANVILNDQQNYIDARTFFEDLWKTSTPLIDQSNYEEFENKVIKKIWINNIANPFAMYLRVLDEYFGIKKNNKVSTAHSITGGEFLDLKYQTDAVHKALEIIENHNGVIIADVVGLGKSIISSIVANNLNITTIVIAPPHLIDQWEEYGDKFGFKPRIYSSGNIKSALEKEITNRKFNSTQKLIIVDEAHKYRNENTHDYTYLHQLCQDNKVMLLTATPFNNSPQDLYSLIKLFQVPGRSTIKTVDNLAYRFEGLISKFKKIRSKAMPSKADEEEVQIISKNLKSLIEPLVIRRSRLDLVAIKSYKKDLELKSVTFAKVNDPDLVEYELGDLYPKYIKTLEMLCPSDESSNSKNKRGFLGAKYKPTNYLKDIGKYQKEFETKLGIDFQFIKLSQNNLAKLMKRLMVKRFESSIAAFRSTLENMINSHINTLDWYTKLGLVVIYKKGNLPTAEEILKDTSQELDSYILFEPDDIKIQDENLAKIKGLETLESRYFSVEFEREVNQDLEILKKIQEIWFGDNLHQSDPKFEAVLNKIKSSLRAEPNRKIVIFSEFADTVDYLEGKFQSENMRILKYTSKIAKSNLKNIVRNNFDAGLDESLQKNDYDIIVATDAISEGCNLHRAGMIINYDIPFNPTRVIQRVGRINRINKKVFDNIYILNLFPSLIGKKEYRVEGLAMLKMSMIHALLGEDTKVLKAQETGDLKRFLIDDFKRSEEKAEELSWDTEYQNFIREHRESKSLEYQEAVELPKKSRVARKFHRLEINPNIQNQNLFASNQSILIFAKKGKDYVFKLREPSGEIQTLTAEKGIYLFQCLLGEEGYPASSEFDKLYQDIKTQLFTTKTDAKKDKGELDTLKNLRYLQKYYPDDSFLKDLVRVISTLKGLPDGILKDIRAVNYTNPDAAFIDIKKLIPKKYLNSIISRSNQHNEDECILFAQELLENQNSLLINLS